jgi:hypothetical protein
MRYAMRHRLARWISRIALIPLLGGMTGGCPATGALSNTADPNAPLAGLWSLSRTSIQVTCSWTFSGGGQVMNTWNTSTLQPLDITDFPSELQSLVQQWNNGLVELNAHLNEALPADVFVSFPVYGQIALAAEDNPAQSIVGAIDSTAAYIFLADFSGDVQGDAQGGGTVLQAATIQGSFNRTSLTTTGYAARTLQIVGSGVGGNGLALTIQVRVNYTGSRTGDATP